MRAPGPRRAQHQAGRTSRPIAFSGVRWTRLKNGITYHLERATNAYFVPDDNVVGLLSEAARRGVDVRVLTAGGATDVRVVRMAGGAQYEALLRAGVRIYAWQPTVMHAKTFVVDGLWSTSDR